MQKLQESRSQESPGRLGNNWQIAKNGQILESQGVGTGDTGNTNSAIFLGFFRFSFGGRSIGVSGISGSAFYLSLFICGSHTDKSYD